jgi:hypothetical protein
MKPVGEPDAGDRHVRFDENPTADATSPILGANVVDFFVVTPGQRVAVLQAGTAGTISVRK